MRIKAVSPNGPVLTIPQPMVVIRSANRSTKAYLNFIQTPLAICGILPKR